MTSHLRCLNANSAENYKFAATQVESHALQQVSGPLADCGA